MKLHIQDFAPVHFSQPWLGLGCSCSSSVAPLSPSIGLLAGGTVLASGGIASFVVAVAVAVLFSVEGPLYVGDSRDIWELARSSGVKRRKDMILRC